MSKITRLEQLANENSLYRVSGVFNGSEICYIKFNSNLGWYTISAILPRKGAIACIMTKSKLAKGLSTGRIGIMCLQRGKPRK